MRVRTARSEDLPQIDHIYNQAIEEGFKTAHTEPMSNREREEWFMKFSDHSRPLYLADNNGKVEGWLSVSSYRPGRKALSGTVEVSFYIRREFRGNGVGTVLLKHLIDQAPTLGIRTLLAILIETNRPSVALLEKFEFETWGRLPDVIRHNGDTRSQIIMGKRLING
jgi:L-amino acid N-acyltransferase YncA